MKSLKNLTGDSLEQLIDYQVVDQNGDEIGSLHSLWSEPQTGAVEFLGVKTGWLFGHNHVVPAEKAELDDSENVVRLPYTAMFIKEAPSISADAEISEAEEAEIYQYYGLDQTGQRSGPMMTPPEDATSTGSFTGDVRTGADLDAVGAGVTPFADTSAGSANRDEASANRWRRTTGTRSPIEDAGATIPTSTGSVLDDLTPGDSSATRTTASTTQPDTYGTSNLYGSTGSVTPVSADALGSASGAMLGEMISNETGGGNARAAGVDVVPGGTNEDPITGEPGSHPVGTGAGALSGGAAGMAIGAAVGGPVGAPVGGIIGGIVGAVGGGLIGKGIAESINPTEEDAYWRSNFRGSAYFENDYEYADYEPAYRVGYEGYARHADQGRSYEDAEADLKQNYEQSRGSSRLEWEKAKAATRDAWERLKAKTANMTK